MRLLFRNHRKSVAAMRLLPSLNDWFFVTSYHLQIKILQFVSLGFAFDSTMLGGIRKFCDYHFICQFFFKRIVYMHIDATVCGCPVNRRQKKRGCCCILFGMFTLNFLT